GEFQCTPASARQHYEQRNASDQHAAHVLQIWLRASRAELGGSLQLQRFTAAERRGALRVVASPDGRRGSLRLRGDVFIHSALLEPGQHVVHELSIGRKSWLHVLWGEIMLADSILIAGDGAAIEGQNPVSLTARRAAEIVLVDLGA
ncbi:MAG TPA: hypothetical protein VJR89_05425, partial [Polyangiales bacterium]|nr:hypothetical protein [Polyangiales bacterium]